MINLTDIRTSFHASIATFETTRKVPIFSAIPKSVMNQKIYSWMALNHLIQVLKQEIPDSFDEEDDLLERFTIRFVVDKNMRIWFAREGTCSSAVPAHSDMIADEDVYTAGNLVFSKDYTTIIEITNKSGHYEPSFGSLVFFLSLLLGLERNPDFPVRIAEEMKLVTYQKQTDFKPVAISECSLSKADLSLSIPFDPRIETTGEYPFIKVRKRQGVYFLRPDLSEDSFILRGSTDSTSSIDSEYVDDLGFDERCNSSHDLYRFFSLSTQFEGAKTKRILDEPRNTESPLQIGSFFCLDSPNKTKGETPLVSSSHRIVADKHCRKSSRKEAADNTHASSSNNRFGI